MSAITSTDLQTFSIPIDETSIYDQSLIIEKAKGIYLYAHGDTEPYIDLLMGYSSTNFGHTNEKIQRFVVEAIKKYDNITSFNSQAKIELSKKLIQLLPKTGNKVVYYPVGGTKAIDAAIKLAKAYTKKDTIIAFNNAFHGFSYGGIAVTDEHFVEKKQYGSLPGSVKTFPFPNRRNKSAQKDSENILKSIDIYLEKNQKKVAGLLFEPIQGAAGFIIPPEGFLQKLIKLTKKYKIVSICDEIQVGMGRTGSFYYINQLNLNPDIVLLGKSLAGGYYPLSAVIANKELFQAVNHERSGFDSTFANNFLGMEIAKKVIDFIDEDKVLERVNKTGAYFMEQLKTVLAPFKFIREFDGIGMAYSYRIESPMGSIKDSATLAKLIKREAFKHHLIIQTAGVDGNYMKISPSFLITRKEIKFIMQKLKYVLANISTLI